ncbi:hypothetical protein ACFX2C_016906 [Malus domestica]
MKIQNKNHNKRLNNNTNKVHNQNPSHLQNRYQSPSCAASDSRQFECYNCHKMGHLARNCRNKKSPAPQANLVEEQLIAMISEINFVDGFEGWWVDTGASRHVCYDRSLFKTYSVAEGRKVLLGDSHSTDVAGSGEVELRFTSGKTMIMKDVMHTPTIRKNLTSGFLLNKAGFIQTIGADMYTLTKNEVFVGKEYATDGMLKLNVDKMS